MPKKALHFCDIHTLLEAPGSVGMPQLVGRYLEVKDSLHPRMFVGLLRFAFIFEGFLPGVYDSPEPAEGGFRHHFAIFLWKTNSELLFDRSTFSAIARSAGIGTLRMLLLVFGVSSRKPFPLTNTRFRFTWTVALFAFDVCKNVKGQEYSDAAFRECVGRIGQQIGFTWGGSWKTFVDKPHFQWDAHGKYTGSMIRRKKFPPAMPLYEEDEMDISKIDFSTLTDTQVEQLYNRIQAHLRTQNATMPKELAEAKAMGITDGTYPLAIPTREQVAVMVKRGVKSVK